MPARTKKPVTGLRPAKQIIGDLNVEDLLSAPPRIARKVRRHVRRAKRVAVKPLLALANGPTSHFKDYEYITNVTIAFFGFLALLLLLLFITLRSLELVPKGF